MKNMTVGEWIKIPEFEIWNLGGFLTVGVRELSVSYWDIITAKLSSG